jgi:uncharacterized protein YdhG (YjbR/CyaY superfamily)
MAAKPTTIDEFLSTLTADKRATLEHLRRTITSIVPNATECISYGIPGFRLGGRLLVWFGAGKNHCAFYPGAHPIKMNAAALEKYDTSKGTVRFPVDKPLPATLVRKLMKSRLEEYASNKPVAKKAARQR